MRQPVGCGIRVVVDVRDELARRVLEPDVARVAEPAVLGRDEVEAPVDRALRGTVSRAVVDDDHLVVGIVEPRERSEALVERPTAVVGADHH